MIKKRVSHHETIWHILETRNVSVLVDDMAHSLTFFVFFLLHCSRCSGSDIIAKEAKNQNFCPGPQKNLCLDGVRRCRVGAPPPPLRASGNEAPAEAPVVWRAGGGLQVASWAQPSASPLGGMLGMFMEGAHERMCCSIHHCQGRLSPARGKKK